MVQRLVSIILYFNKDLIFTITSAHIVGSSIFSFEIILIFHITKALVYYYFLNS